MRDNIRAGMAGSTDAEIEAAAKAAHADEFIRRLSRGYDTPVGELGSQVSGGQRQRLSIARAFLKDAPIVLLDEATTALDSETERLIQQAIDRLTRGRTTIVIAHRLSTVMHAGHYLRDRRRPQSESGYPRRAGRPGWHLRAPLPAAVRRASCSVQRR